ncbi:helix-turn-helix domain-containing protein [Chromohalobacter canadensis]|uniref:helix-turn-helix domain-containing protein n=1 Tax=Chromohalobacter canadensis TaxID=141389 RepID=UPI0024106426|nr:helix-turn-helix domain-containing protein [Chromohalobacter canadensis]
MNMEQARPYLGSSQGQLSEFIGFLEFEEVGCVSRSLPVLRKKQILVRQGETFHGLYVVRCGMLKQSYWNTDGEEVTHFLLPGDVIGLDAIVGGCYLGRVTALETVGIVQIPFARINDFPGGHENYIQVLCYLSSFIQREYMRIRQIKNQSAEVRLARFFLTMSHNFQVQGYSPYRFRLPMTRCDIASYLSMSFETISRLIGRFKKNGVLSAKGHEYCIHDIYALRRAAEIEEC